LGRHAEVFAHVFQHRSRFLHIFTETTEGNKSRL
jgi:hypothetical protein